MFDKITLDRIELMHPTIREQLKKDYLEINKNLPKGVRLRFTQTLRTIKEQDDLYAQGRTKKGKIVTNAKGGQSIHNYGLACFSDDTKILTKEGFKYFYELHEDEEVMTFKDGVMRYDKPLAIVSNDYEGDMINIKTRSVNLLVTPNHKIICQKKRKRKFPEDNKWEFVKADSIDYKYRIPTSGNYESEDINIPSIKFYNRSVRIEDTLNWYTFMGYWISEGSVAGSKNNKPVTHSSRYAIRISQSKEKNYNTWLKIKECLTRLGVSFHYNGKDFIFHNKGLWEYLFKIGNSYTKYIPKYMLHSNKEHLSALYTSLIEGDGTFYKNGEYYCTASEKLADDFLTLCVHLGKSATISSRIKSKVGDMMPHGELLKSEPKTIYEIRTRTSNTQELRTSNNSSRINKVYYKGVVYCVSTTDGAIVVMRNGKVSVCGNCDIVILLDKDNNGTFESVSWEVDKHWKRVVDFFKSKGWTWGGDFKTLYDAPHFEYTQGKTWKHYSELPKDKNGYVIL